MKKGYRLSNAHALANYYADVSNVANFAGPREMGGALVVDPRYRYGQSSAQEIAYNSDMQRRAIKGGPSLGQRVSRLQYGAGQQAARAGRAVGTGFRNSSMLARRYPVAAGVAGLAGAAGIGGAGYAGYRALREEDEQV